MLRLLILAGAAILVWRMFFGRWPWEQRVSAREQALGRARKLLTLPPGATRPEVLAAHRRLVATVHPDRGGSAGQVHEADAARDLLLANLPPDAKESA